MRCRDFSHQGTEPESNVEVSDVWQIKKAIICIILPKTCDQKFDNTKELQKQAGAFYISGVFLSVL